MERRTNLLDYPSSTTMTRRKDTAFLGSLDNEARSCKWATPKFHSESESRIDYRRKRCMQWLLWSAFSSFFFFWCLPNKRRLYAENHALPPASDSSQHEDARGSRHEEREGHFRTSEWLSQFDRKPPIGGGRSSCCLFCETLQDRP